MVTEEELTEQRQAAAYLHAALARAEYKVLAEDGTIFGSIPGFQGVWANEETFAECHTELASALRDWMAYRLTEHLDLPNLEGVPTPTAVIA
jgi:predicted RNase H-like HicB family nuclease